MGLFDVHAHLTHSRFEDDLAEVLVRARERGLSCIISNGLNPTDNRAVLDLAKRDPIVRAAVGFYPVETVLRAMRHDGVDYPSTEADYSPDEGIESVRELAAQAIAVGEIGLDGYWCPAPYWEQQEQVFRQLVQIALDANKPIIIHTRKREKRALEILLEMGAQRVDWHCFGSKVKLAHKIAEAGHHLSIPANARRSESFTRMLQTLPREQILLETDCPYLSPEPGSRNEPANVAGTADYAAELWDCSVNEVTKQLEDNFQTLFRVAP